MIDVLLQREISRGWTEVAGSMRSLFARLGLGRIRLWATLAGVSVCVAGLTFELRSSFIESLVFPRLAREMTFQAAPGPSPQISFPRNGPYDQRLGYAGLPGFIDRLKSADFVVRRQARLSLRLEGFVASDGYAIYREKMQGGLTILDRDGAPLYASRFPERIYGNFDEIPSLVVRTLLYVEDRHLLDSDYPRQNPAVDWKRFSRAVLGQIAGLVDPHLRQGGASRLATQIEKFRHSPDGLTQDAREKLRQMLTASLRAYQGGPYTEDARRKIVTTYLNSTPLGSRPNYGEIIGIGDGLWQWYGTELATANGLLDARLRAGSNPIRRASLYKEVLSLLLAERRPGYYLVSSPHALNELCDTYLRLLAKAGVIDEQLRDAALKLPLEFWPDAPAPKPASFVSRKAVDALRTELSASLGVPGLNSLDRLDLTVTSTLDRTAQRRVSELLERLSDPGYARSLGLTGADLLDGNRPERVAYSFVLYERGADRNYLRVHADSVNQPFDINSGAKLILGSTAKLRTLVTYLDVVAELHGRLARLSTEELRSTADRAADPLTRWAAGYLADAQDRGLQPILDAALRRRYSASPYETFFTGSGAHVFHNFDKSEDIENPTVEDAFERSINLAFVRLLRDVVRYFTAQDENARQLLSLGSGPARGAYLRRFANQEGRQYLDRFYADYRKLSPDAALAILAGRTTPTAVHLAIVFRSARPTVPVEDLRGFLVRRLGAAVPDDRSIAALYAKYAPGRFSLADRGYLTGIHPLELWLVAYLQDHPGASRSEIIRAGTDARQEVYRWLFKTRNIGRQNFRIRILQEQDAFERILRDWQSQGYPFSRLVPSLATAIGSSGDRPDALATLMGIIVNGGLKLPNIDLEELGFATGTPYETQMGIQPRAATRVLAPEVAMTLRRALEGVVARGTGRRLQGLFRTATGEAVAIGGKTGTGDNRYESFDLGRRLIASHPVDRTATLVFFLGDRFFGTVGAYVAGPDAGKSDFTSALTVELLRALSPALEDLMGVSTGSNAVGAPRGADRPPQVGSDG
jgi:membrane peptidoglycan carboxypeptidase